MGERIVLAVVGGLFALLVPAWFWGGGLLFGILLLLFVLSIVVSGALMLIDHYDLWDEVFGVLDAHSNSLLSVASRIAVVVFGIALVLGVAAYYFGADSGRLISYQTIQQTVPLPGWATVILGVLELLVIGGFIASLWAKNLKAAFGLLATAVIVVCCGWGGASYLAGRVDLVATERTGENRIIHHTTGAPLVRVYNSATDGRLHKVAPDVLYGPAGEPTRPPNVREVVHLSRDGTP